MRLLNRLQGRLATIDRLTEGPGAASRDRSETAGFSARRGFAGVKTRKNGGKSPKNPKNLEKTGKNRGIGAVSAKRFR
jgi:hypothetical protein